MGNEDQIRRVFYNLVDNAIKYTARGGTVDIGAQVYTEKDLIRVMVTDTGFGIAADNLPHIFERFYRVEATRAAIRTTPGQRFGVANRAFHRRNAWWKNWCEQQAGQRYNLLVRATPA